MHRCAVCYDRWETSSPVRCSTPTCHNAVHESCFGTLERSATGHWFCWQCLAKRKNQSLQVCSICRRPGGPIKRTEEGGWAHIICAMYLPEVRQLHASQHNLQLYFFALRLIAHCFVQTYLSKEPNLEPICGIGDILPSRFKCPCVVCARATGGACAPCSWPRCTSGIHPLCGHTFGLTLVCAFCPCHWPFVQLKPNTLNGCLQSSKDLPLALYCPAHFCKAVELYSTTGKLRQPKPQKIETEESVRLFSSLRLAC